ncbi:MAG: hypothetical protein Q7T86_07280 [Hyphomicrobiaceae bacterium]|nr:hypothetical protein [Hyphomicrobiaceae bacterium]
MFAKTEKTENSNLMFKDSFYARLFAILLVDFLSEVKAFKGPVPLGLKPVPSGVRPTDRTMLFHLRGVAASPNLGRDATRLVAATEAFGDWLEAEFTAEVNFSDISAVTDVRISRIQYLKLCGDIAKHNLARLSTNVGHLRKLLEISGHPVTQQDAYLAINNFRERFLDDILIYHSSQIGEFLNNIRWAIYEYLQPDSAGRFIGRQYLGTTWLTLIACPARSPNR